MAITRVWDKRLLLPFLVYNETQKKSITVIESDVGIRLRYNYVLRLLAEKQKGK